MDRLPWSVDAPYTLQWNAIKKFIGPYYKMSEYFDLVAPYPIRVHGDTANQILGGLQAAKLGV